MVLMMTMMKAQGDIEVRAPVVVQPPVLAHHETNDRLLAYSHRQDL
jgi:hypothetical protein